MLSSFLLYSSPSIADSRSEPRVVTDALDLGLGYEQRQLSLIALEHCHRQLLFRLVGSRRGRRSRVELLRRLQEGCHEGVHRAERTVIGSDNFLAERP